MKFTQFAIFELHPACNLGRVHTACPNRSPERWKHLDTSRALDDDTIVGLACELYERHGFRGLVGFHYYNEPMLQCARMLGIIGRIRDRVASSRFVLWTNGTVAPERLEDLQVFEQVHVTDYTADGHKPVIRSANMHAGMLDKRLSPGQSSSGLSPCLRPFTEFIVDYHGNVHLCCYDWKGEACQGNVFSERLADIVTRWQQTRTAIAWHTMQRGAPVACITCPLRTGGMTQFDHGILHGAVDYVRALRAKTNGPAVVVVAYNIPAERLRQHIRLNGDVYVRAGAQLYVVAEPSSQRIEPAIHVVFDEGRLPVASGKPVFSLSATKNAGIAAALCDRRSPIIATDIDVEVTADTMRRVAELDGQTALVPVYRMRTWHDRTDPQDHFDYGCTGTIAMTAANWARLQYDERLYGYGGEDGELCNRISRSRVRIDRGTTVLHHAHTPGVNPRRVPGAGNDQCWNRGFNPDRFRENAEVMRRG